MREKNSEKIEQIVNILKDIGRYLEKNLDVKKNLKQLSEAIDKLDIMIPRQFTDNGQCFAEIKEFCGKVKKFCKKYSQFSGISDYIQQLRKMDKKLWEKYTCWCLGFSMVAGAIGCLSYIPIGLEFSSLNKKLSERLKVIFTLGGACITGVCTCVIGGISFACCILCNNVVKFSRQQSRQKKDELVKINILYREVQEIYQREYFEYKKIKRQGSFFGKLYTAMKKNVFSYVKVCINFFSDCSEPKSQSETKNISTQSNEKKVVIKDKNKGKNKDKNKDSGNGNGNGNENDNLRRRKSAPVNLQRLNNSQRRLKKTKSFMLFKKNPKRDYDQEKKIETNHPNSKKNL
ncbi:MAG: hypothetical protein PVG30_03220 [Gammaproteobacteria bacterium]|jgi:hypothetical protein